jgi:hypothetical protein
MYFARVWASASLTAFLVSRAHQFLVHGVAREAGLVLQQLLRVGGKRCGA